MLVKKCAIAWSIPLFAIACSDNESTGSSGVPGACGGSNCTQGGTGAGGAGGSVIDAGGAAGGPTVDVILEGSADGAEAGAGGEQADVANDRPDVDACVEGTRRCSTTAVQAIEACTGGAWRIVARCGAESPCDPATATCRPLGDGCVPPCF
jgi:hypothetical protein